MRLVAVDGKSIRRSFAHAWDASGMAHLVSAFAAENRVVFAQLAAAGRGQELEAMWRLIELLALDEATVVTVDGLGYQRDLAERILAKDADYVLAVKRNQPALYAAVSRLLDEALLERFAGVRHGCCGTTDGDHGRVETQADVGQRRTRRAPAGRRPGAVAGAGEPGGRRVAARGVPGQPPPSPPPPSSSGQDRHYFISSLDGTDAARMAGVIRGHWTIENGLHWQLDVSFGEDRRRVRKDHAAENFGRLCRIALNLLKAEPTAKIGVKAKRLRACWDEPYLLRFVPAEVAHRMITCDWFCQTNETMI